MTVLRSIVTAGVALAVLAAPMASEGQMHATRVGLLGPDEEPRFSEIGRGLRQGLRE